MFDWVHNRRIRGHEFLDEDDVDPRELDRALGFIRKINATLGYTRSVLHHLKRFSTTWKLGQRIDIIDLATGSADIPRAILRWAAANNFDVHVVCRVLLDKKQLPSHHLTLQEPPPVGSGSSSVAGSKRKSKSERPRSSRETNHNSEPVA